MVNNARSALLALLAGSAAAHQAHRHQHQHAKRGDSGSYSYAPLPSYSLSNGSSTSPAAGTGYPINTAPQGSTYIAGKPTSTTTHYLTSTSTDIIYQTMTVEPVPVYPKSSPAAASSYAASSPAAANGQCAPVYVTITVTEEEVEHHAQTSAAAANGAVYYQTTKEQKHKSEYSTAPAASSYEVHSSPAAASSYKASTPAASSYPVKPSPSSTPASGSKRGLAYTAASALSGFHSYSASVPWAWNWNSESGGLSSNFEYVPILNNLVQSSTFPSSAQAAVAAGAKYVMGCNEPDMTTGGGGSALSPQQAAQAYQTYIMPFAKSGVKLGSISVTSNNATSGNQNGVSPSSGLAYLAEWQAACSGCQVDFVQLHWYGAAGQSGSEQAATFNQYVDSACAEVEAIFGAGTKVWFTEFSALPTLDQDTSGVNIEFMKTALPYLESHPGVERYSYFSASPNLLVNSDGSLTAAGQAYCA